MFGVHSKSDGDLLLSNVEGHSTVHQHMHALHIRALHIPTACSRWAACAYINLTWPSCKMECGHHSRPTVMACINMQGTAHACMNGQQKLVCTFDTQLWITHTCHRLQWWSASYTTMLIMSSARRQTDANSVPFDSSIAEEPLLTRMAEVQVAQVSNSIDQPLSNAVVHL